MRIQFTTSDAAIRAALQRGETLPRTVTLDADPADLDAEVRALLAKHLDLSNDGGTLTLPDEGREFFDPEAWNGAERRRFRVDGGTLHDLVALLRVYDEGKEKIKAFRAEQERKAHQERLDKLRGWAAGENRHYGDTRDRSRMERALDEAEAPDDLRRAVLARVDQNVADYEEKRRLKAEEREAEEAKQKEREAREAAVREAQLAWAREHGSARLVKALEAGYEATGLYVEERIALDHPGFSRISDEHEWKERVSPSEEALDLAAAHEGAVVVWLTSADEDDYDYEPFEGREAVVIEGYLADDPGTRQGYTLIREL